MTSSVELQLLLNRMVDEGLSEQDDARLAEMLAASEEARECYLRFMILHVELVWSQGAAAGRDSGEEPLPLVGNVPARRHSLPATLVGAMAAVAVALTGWSFVLHRGSAPEWARVVSVTGAVSFRGNGSEQDVAGFTAIPAGELMLKGDSAALQLRLGDSILISLNGEADVVVDPDKPRDIHLRRGSLTAEVQRQIPGQPLVLVTPTARIEVLGTVLSVLADAERTRVHVDSGKVKVTRLVDGRSIEISGHESCLASLNTNESLGPIPAGRSRPGFVHTFSSPPPGRWKGAWLEASPGVPGRFAAVPCIMGQRLDGDMQPVIHYGITLRPSQGIDLGALPENASFGLIYRVQKPHSFYLMISAHSPDGRFAGNFECKVDSEQGQNADDGFRRLTIPISNFQALAEKHPVLNSGDEPSLLLITTFGEDVGLEVSQVEITGRQGDSP